MKTPVIYSLGNLIQIATSPRNMITTRVSERMVQNHPKRPEGNPRLGFRRRFHAAYLVFTGKADAVRWPGKQ